MIQVLASAYYEVGYFADDFVRYGLANFWMFAMLLAIAGGRRLATSEQPGQIEDRHQTAVDVDNPPDKLGSTRYRNRP